jgi:tryptophan synthase beta chain
LLYAKRYSQHNGGAQIAIKREDMSGAGSKLVMIVAGQVLMAKHLGYKTVVTGSQFTRTGVIMAALANRMGMASAVFMDQRMAQQNSALILHIRCTGARLEFSKHTDKARDLAVDFCTQAPEERFLVMGVEAASAPFAVLNQHFVSTLGRETMVQSKSMFKTHPHLMVCRGQHTADAIGWFDPFLSQPQVRLVCVEAKDSLNESMSREADPPRISHMQLSHEQLFNADAILEGSEYPAVRREHATYKESGQVEYVNGSVPDARAAIKGLARFEGLICPIRTAFAIGWAARAAKEMPVNQLVVVNMVEPYDKDLRNVAQVLGATA